MIIRPRPQSLPQMSVLSKQSSHSTYILHEKAPFYYWEGQSSLSIKTFFSGRALYTLGKGYYAVDDCSYLILNHQQPYTIAIEALEPIESFCIFFEPGFAEEIYRSHILSAASLLDRPGADASSLLHFFERTYPHDHLVSPVLFQLRAAVQSETFTSLWLSEQLHRLMQGLLHVHLSLYRELEQLPAIRIATREELYRRLYRAHDFIEALYTTSITLDEIAAVAELSPNHFLRMFKQLFHVTPHQYILRKRLECAQQLLRDTEQSVTEICFSLGFESLSSFSWYFQQKTGASPRMYRTQKK
ncbi:helix-turn-helix transcriptional regulator [Tengunoibacter tsumagoiensis]|uniref:HTH araC/xylS-type domain-containing protein n=1 Tax=Tengunoibacter tsumagoiensis TaxID=2014871 RepID=A0A402A386_9CHLR|nr:AraC family transcriptional regulator [Tengunoibacter tsumagoiensis]GCE13613.1 hypothetical protein KTT_34720 [Tengunoibacter tsumagoiensis]